MAEITLQPAAGERKGRRRVASLKIDMTPMVDLGFLLITFFIFTTTLGEKTSLALTMPKDGPEIPVKQKEALTMLLDADDKVFIYAGLWEEAVNENRILKTTYNEADGAGSSIRAKQQALGKDKDALVFIIKPLNGASYQNVIDALDEATIHDIKRYVIVKPDAEEAAYVAER